MKELLNPNWCSGLARNWRDTLPYAFSNKYQCTECYSYEKTCSCETTRGFLKTEKKIRIGINKLFFLYFHYFLLKRTQCL